MDRTLLNKCTKFGAKKFLELLSNHIFGVGSFFKPHPVDVIVDLCRYLLKNWLNKKYSK